MARKPQAKASRLRADVLKAVEAMLAAQMRPSQIAATLGADPKYDLSPRQSHRYIQHVRDLIAKEDEEDKPRHRHWIRHTLRLVVQRALARNQLASAVAAVDRIARLDGLYADTKVAVEHSGSIEQRLIDLPRDERRARLNELFDLYSVEVGDSTEPGQDDSN